MHYKMEQHIPTFRLAEMKEHKEDYVRDQFARKLAQDFRHKLRFTMPDYPEGYLKNAQRSISIPSSVESFTTEFIFMPLEHWELVKQMIQAVAGSVLPGQRHMLQAVIDEIESK